ncbi:MAG: DnaJ C-terminal domain-containing protein [Geminicoccaceae bacterium]
MAESLYRTLGVSKTASEAEIQKAYRKLAKECHPDLKPGDKQAEERFKRISAANEILSDKAKRARYDRGEIDEQGNERAFAGTPRGSRGGARADAGGFRFNWGGRGGGGGAGPDLEDILSEVFGAAGRGAGGRGGFQARGEDVRASLTVDLVDAARGAKRRVVLPGGRSLELTIPAGLESGQTLRLKGQGEPGMGGGPAGDALIEVSVRELPGFSRKGMDVVSDQPVPLATALLGGKVRVPTLDGEVSLSIPKGSSSGRMLRLKGKGIHDTAGRKGDQLVRVLVTLPDDADGELEAVVREWARRKGQLDPAG